MATAKRQTSAPAPIDRAKVRALLGDANALRESGVSLHQHPVMYALEEVCRDPLAYLVFIAYPDDMKIPDAELDELADGLVNRTMPWGAARKTKKKPKTA